MGTPPKPLVQQDPQPVKPVHVGDEGLAATGPHTYEGRGVGYQPASYVHQEYPKMLYRERTEDELKAELEAVPREVWLNKETDLLLLTGHNQPKTPRSHQAWVNRPVDVTVNNAKEEKEQRAEGFMSMQEIVNARDKAAAKAKAAPKPAAE